MKAIMESSSVYTAPIFGWISVSYFAKIAHILGNTADEAKYQTTADKMRNAIVAELIDKDGNCVSDMMGAYVLFLYFDLVPEQFPGLICPEAGSVHRRKRRLSRHRFPGNALPAGYPDQNRQTGCGP